MATGQAGLRGAHSLTMTPGWTRLPGLKYLVWATIRYPNLTSEQMSNTFSIDPASLIATLIELKTGYRGFEWESDRWKRDNQRRSPYRVLVLFGLSPRTRDGLLADVCRRFFRRFPGSQELAKQGEDFQECVKAIVRQGQAPFVLSLSQVLADRGAVPKTKEELLKINGVGHKVAECVLAYGWGEDALSLDANVYRVLNRIHGDGARHPKSTGESRELLKCLYQKHRKGFVGKSITMVDIHEILRLHGQVCCTRKPDCAACPVSRCRSRLVDSNPTNGQLIPLGFWDDWRELLLEPDSGAMPKNSGLETLLS